MLQLCRSPLRGYLRLQSYWCFSLRRSHSTRFPMLWSTVHAVPHIICSGTTYFVWGPGLGTCAAIDSFPPFPDASTDALSGCMIGGCGNLEIDVSAQARFLSCFKKHDCHSPTDSRFVSTQRDAGLRMRSVAKEDKAALRELLVTWREDRHFRMGNSPYIPCEVILPPKQLEKLVASAGTFLKHALVEPKHIQKVVAWDMADVCSLAAHS
ncbi:hypothetical protein B0H14DRAFT_3134812 [Mycena olivaceomarginata]|nr:hypothetical protein B0H14DRAFT_3134812 [Mycena olivaceomarginata]